MFPVDEEWQTISDLISILDVFKIPTDSLQGRLYSTLPKSLIATKKIYNNLTALALKFTKEAEQFPEKVSFCFKLSLDNPFHSTQTN